MDIIPFPCEYQLCRKLCTVYENQVLRTEHLDDESISLSVDEACGEEDVYLPGQPRISLHDSDFVQQLQQDLLTPDLNNLQPRLWLVAKQDSRHIFSLTEQVVRGRQIVLTENPELHLVWTYNRVFIKPIPKYLLSHAFWQYLFASKCSPVRDLEERQELLRAAKGFLRTYAFLIRHKSDFLVAKQESHRLLPRKTRYCEFGRFIASCEASTADADVSPRYTYGELRLMRLNFWSKIFLNRLVFQKVHWKYAANGAHLAHTYNPLLFVSGALSVIFNALQVGLSAQPFLARSGGGDAWACVAQGFAICSLVVVAILVLYFILAVSILALWKTIFALSDLFRKKTHHAAGQHISA